MTERIQRIKEAGGLSAAETLTGMYVELLQQGEKAKGGKAADIREYQSLCAAFRRALEEFEGLYGTELFKTLSAVYEYLAGAGYKIASRTLYQHKSEGKLKEFSGGGFLKKHVEEYAEKTLAKVGAYGSENLADRKSEAEIQLKTLRAERERLHIDEAMGLLIQRDVVGREFAARIEEIKRAFEDMEGSLPVILAGRDEREIRDILKARHNFILEQYSRKLETLK